MYLTGDDPKLHRQLDFEIWVLFFLQTMNETQTQYYPTHFKLSRLTFKQDTSLASAKPNCKNPFFLAPTNITKYASFMRCRCDKLI